MDFRRPSCTPRIKTPRILLALIVRTDREKPYKLKNHKITSHINIEMIKSNGYEGEQGFNRCRSPQNLKKNQPPSAPISLDHERPKFSTAVERPMQIKVEPTFKEIKESK